MGIAEAAEVAGVRAIESPIWIAEVVAAAVWVEAVGIALAAGMFREAAAVNGAAAPLVAAASVAVLHELVVHEVPQAWAAAVAVAALVVVEAVDEAAEVVDGSATVVKSNQRSEELFEAKK